MKHKCIEDAIAEAEFFLRSEFQYNEAHGILQSDNLVIQRLLGNQARMDKVYGELNRKLGWQDQRQHVLRLVVEVAAGWNSETAKKVQDQVRLAKRLNGKIAKKARELAELIWSRDASCPDAQTPEDYHLVDLLIAAAAHSGRRETRHYFQKELEPRLKSLRHDFDLKYWPRTHEVLEALAVAQEESDPTAKDRLMEAAISTRTRSNADFTRALYEGIEELKDAELGIPPEFSLSAEAIACCAYSALGLSSETPEETVGKRVQRYRGGKVDSSSIKT